MLLCSLCVIFLLQSDYCFCGGKKSKKSNRKPAIQNRPVMFYREVLLKKYPLLPELENPSSQLCTYNQFLSDSYAFWCKEFAELPHFHRKQWEYCYVLQALYHYGKIQEGSKGIGFGVGSEPLPAVFAKYGCQITATDQSFENAKTTGWVESNQYLISLERLWKPQICEKDLFFRNVSFREVNMNDIPADLKDFDFTWSSCALEHLGSIENGLSFIKNSLNCLKTGGVAVHTTEFNLSSNIATIRAGGTVLYRERDIERLIAELTALGHTVIPLNLHPGTSDLDIYVDFPPYQSDNHIKLLLNNFVSTSFGIIVIKN